MDTRIFSSVDEALCELNLKIYPNNEINGTLESGIESIKFTSNTYSYNRIKNNMRDIYLVGKGPKSQPGHPCGHQALSSQNIFIKSRIDNEQIHMIHEIAKDKLQYLGKYQIKNIVNKISNEGFVFCEIYLRLFKPDKV